MYAALHNLRRKPTVPVGFIHLPYEARQAGGIAGLPSMPLATMERRYESQSRNREISAVKVLRD